MKRVVLFFFIIISILRSHAQLQHAPGYINTSVEIQYWNTNTGNWISNANSKDSNYYHPPDTLRYLDVDRVWDTTSKAYSKDRYQVFWNYTTFGKEQHRIEQQWDTADAAWHNLDQIFFTYDGNNNFVDEIQQVWDTAKALWVNAYHVAYTYDYE